MLLAACSSNEAPDDDGLGGGPGTGGNHGGNSTVGGSGGSGASGGVGAYGGGYECTFPPAPSAEIVVQESYAFHDKAYLDSRVWAQVWDGPYPSWHEVALAQGHCRYLEFKPGLCTPQCSYDEVCTPDNLCVAYPAGVSAGTLTVTGLSQPVVVTQHSYYLGIYHATGQLPENLFDEGDSVSAGFSGDVYPAVTLYATGVAPLDTTLAHDGLAMVDGQDLTITWTAGSNPGSCVELWINGTSSGGHGTPLRDIIWCVAPDTGSLVVAQSMVEKFPHGYSPEICVGVDCPPSVFSRYSRHDVATGNGTTSLIVHSTVQFGYDHPPY